VVTRARAEKVGGVPEEVTAGHPAAAEAVNVRVAPSGPAVMHPHQLYVLAHTSPSRSYMSSEPKGGWVGIIK
jgi:hypothetical protein